MKQKEILVTGGCNYALGVDAKIIPSGICTNSDIIPLEDKMNDSLNPINRCVFCKDGVHCYFAGECENRESMKV